MGLLPDSDRLSLLQQLQQRGNGRDNCAHPPRLAIVGSHPKTRELAPYDDPSFEIWLFNEAPQKVQTYPRWDACLQLHRPEVYASLENWVNKDHWQWLQQDHGPDKRIWMIEVDPRVPNSMRYPLEGVLAMTPYRYLRSSPALALALAIYLGYPEIWLYGSELTSNTEYAYQATNYAFWIGLAHGKGIHLHLECWQSEFFQPIYGYEGEAQIDKSFYELRLTEHETALKVNEMALERLRERLNEAMLKSRFDEVGQISISLETVAMATGETAGSRDEALRYSQRTNMISRQEFERVAAQSQQDGEKKQQDMYHAGGKCEYVWNVWRQTGNVVALEQLRQFLSEKTQHAYDAGHRLGVFRENMLYLSKYDEGVAALGGVRALAQMGMAVPDG